MVQVTAKQNVRDAVAPQRESIPPGWYHALIVAAKGGMTRSTKVGPKPLLTLEIEYQIVKTDAASVITGEDDKKYAGRRVWQAYILEEITTNPSWSQGESFRIQQLIAATHIEHAFAVDGSVSFNSDHLVNKGVKININQKLGTPKQPNDPVPVFNNIERVDSIEQVPDSKLV